jgi:hypothetical protein
MNIAFHVATLTGDQVSRAFPLIQASWPDADLASWQNYVQFFSEAPTDRHSGVLGVYDTAGYICGVFAYQLDRDLRRGLMLTVQLFTAVDLTNSLRTVAAVVDVAESRARELGCKGVQILLRKDQARLALRVSELGLSSEASSFWKPVDPIAMRN